MPLIRYEDADGRIIEVDAAIGSTLMEVALDNMVTGITADCGGGCACGTCHCYISAGPEHQIPAPDPYETSLLATLGETDNDSRLTCQIKVTEALAGLHVRVP